MNATKKGRRPRAGEAANEVLRVRLTKAERARLAEIEVKAGRPIADVVRGWIEQGTVPDSRDYVIARARQPAIKEHVSRWIPRYVWTLHRVPGRLDGIPLAVRRRVLGADSWIWFETPNGMGRAGERNGDIELTGHVRTVGYWRDDDHHLKACGQELAVEVWDHCPTVDERAEWLARRRLEQAALYPRPTHLWVSLPGTRARDRAERRPVRGVESYLSARFVVAVDGFRPTMDLRDLAIGKVPTAEKPRYGETTGGVTEFWAHPVSEVLRVWLTEPTAAQLAETAAMRWAWFDEIEGARRAFNRAQFGWDFRGTNHSAGLGACFELGLDPSTATVEDVQSAFRRLAKAEHPDLGGSGDMGRLVAVRDAARKYVQSRAA